MKGRLPLKKEEVLRYLGYKKKQELTHFVESQVISCMEEIQEIANPRYVFKIFETIVNHEKQTIMVGNTGVELVGKNIYQHLKHAKQMVLFCGTLGLEVERATRMYEVTDLAKAMMLDCAAVELIEQVMDVAEIEIEMSLGEENYLNRRFSPGYGDFPLSIQPQFLNLLDATTKLGITLSQSYLMIPRKSVTAIMGIFDDQKLARPRRKASIDLTRKHVLELQLNVEGLKNR